MTNLRRILLTTSLAAAGSGVATADTFGITLGFSSIPTTQGPTSISTLGTTSTNFSYSLSLPKFSVPDTVLTGATIYLYGEESVGILALSNAGFESATFTASLTDDITTNSSNSANNADRFSDETLTLFSQSMTLGAPPAPDCPENAPSASCNTVSFTPPKLTASNLDLGDPTGEGQVGLEGVVESISGADLANYTGNGNFTLRGSTNSAFTFSDDDPDDGIPIEIIGEAVATAEVSAEVDYTFTFVVTPEPGTTGLMASALLGLGWLLKRFKKS